MITDINKIKKELENFSQIEFPYDIKPNCHVKYLTVKDKQEYFYRGGKFKKFGNECLILENSNKTWRVPKYIKDKNGKTSKTLSHYLANYPQKTEELCTHLAKLGCYLLENHILVSDLHGNNIVFQHLSENSKKLMIVDGIGDRVIFTAPNFFNSIKAGKIIRRWNKFIRRLQADHPSAPLPKEQLYLGNEALTDPKTVTRAH